VASDPFASILNKYLGGGAPSVPSIPSTPSFTGLPSLAGSMQPAVPEFDPFADIVAKYTTDAPQVAAPPPVEDPSLWDQAKDIVSNAVTPANLVRLGGSVAGGVAGGALAGSAIMPGVGTVAGGVIGGILGSAGGEAAAQQIEGRDFDAGEVALAGALGAIPAGPAAGLAGKITATGAKGLLARTALHGAEGASQGLLDSLASTAYREGRLPTAEELKMGALAGGIIGAPLGGGLDALARSGAKPAVRPDSLEAQVRAEQLAGGSRIEQPAQDFDLDLGNQPPPPPFMGGVPDNDFNLESGPSSIAGYFPPVWDQLTKEEQLVLGGDAHWGAKGVNSQYGSDIDKAREDAQRIIRVGNENKARRLAEQEARAQKQNEDWLKMRDANRVPNDPLSRPQGQEDINESLNDLPDPASVEKITDENGNVLFSERWRADEPESRRREVDPESIQGNKYQLADLLAEQKNLRGWMQRHAQGYGVKEGVPDLDTLARREKEVSRAIGEVDEQIKFLKSLGIADDAPPTSVLGGLPQIGQFANAPRETALGSQPEGLVAAHAQPASMHLPVRMADGRQVVGKLALAPNPNSHQFPESRPPSLPEQGVQGQAPRDGAVSGQRDAVLGLESRVGGLENKRAPRPEDTGGALHNVPVGHGYGQENGPGIPVHGETTLALNKAGQPVEIGHLDHGTRVSPETPNQGPKFSERSADPSTAGPVRSTEPIEGAFTDNRGEYQSETVSSVNALIDRSPDKPTRSAYGADVLKQNGQTLIRAGKSAVIVEKDGVIHDWAGESLGSMDSVKTLVTALDMGFKPPSDAALISPDTAAHINKLLGDTGLSLEEVANLDFRRILQGDNKLARTAQILRARAQRDGRASVSGEGRTPQGGSGRAPDGSAEGSGSPRSGSLPQENVGFAGREPANPLNQTIAEVKQRAKAREDFIAAHPEAKFKADTKNGFVAVHKSTRGEGGRWQVTRFDADEQPTGHVNGTWDDVAKLALRDFGGDLSTVRGLNDEPLGGVKFKATDSAPQATPTRASLAVQRVRDAEQNAIPVGRHSIAAPENLREQAAKTAKEYEGLVYAVDRMVRSMARVAGLDNVAFKGLTLDSHANGYFIGGGVRWNDQAAVEYALKMLKKRAPNAKGAQRTALLAQYAARHGYGVLAHEVLHAKHGDHGPAHDADILKLIKSMRFERKALKEAVVREFLASKKNGNQTRTFVDSLTERFFTKTDPAWKSTEAEAQRLVNERAGGNLRGHDLGGSAQVGRPDSGAARSNPPVSPRGEVGRAGPGADLGRGDGVQRDGSGLRGREALAASERAKAGGEVGRNQDFYKGGQFLPSTELPKRYQARRSGSGQVEIEPFKRVPAKEGVQPILGMFGGNDPSRYNEYKDKIQLGNAEDRPLYDKLAEMWARGERWMPVRNKFVVDGPNGQSFVADTAEAASEYARSIKGKKPRGLFEIDREAILDSSTPQQGVEKFSPRNSSEIPNSSREANLQKFMEGSKVVDESGKPLRVYHGSAGSAAKAGRFDFSKLGGSTGHPSAGLGVFFSADPKIAAMFTPQHLDESTWPPKREFADKANVMPVHLAIKNPYRMSFAEFMRRFPRHIELGKPFIKPEFDEFNPRSWPEAAKAEYDEIIDLRDRGGRIDSRTANQRIESLKERHGLTENYVTSEAFRQKLEADGYDGILLKGEPGKDILGGTEYEADSWIAFRPEQIKSATGNSGSFDPANPDIRFSERAEATEPRPIKPIPDKGKGVKPVALRPPGEKYGQPDGDPDIGPNINRMNVTERQKAVSEDVMKDNQGGLDREKTQTWESLDPEIKKIQDTLSDDDLYKLAQKRSLDAAEVQALKQRVDSKARSLDEARETGDHKQYMEKVFDFVAAGRALADDGTGTARALAARRRLMEAKQTDSEAFLQKVFREIDGVTDQQAAELLKAYKTDPSALPSLLGEAMNPGRLSKALYLWRAGLISAVSSHVANLSGGVVEKGANLMETVLSAGIDRLLQKRHGGVRERFAGEAKAELLGVAKAFPEALKTLGSDLKEVAKGKSPEFDMDKPLAHQMQPFTSKPGKAAGKLAGAVYNALTVEDKFTQSIGKTSELYKVALRKAQGDEETAKRIVHEALAEGKHTDIVESAKKAGQRLALQEDPGALVNKLQKMAIDHPWLSVVFPFIRTPANIARRTIERSPIGFLKAKKAYDAFKRGEISRGEAADAIARPLLGTLVLGGFAMYAKAGGMTGSGPTDQKDKSALRDSGWSPYSFVVPLPNGKKAYIPYNRFEPVSSILGFAADIVEIQDEKKAGDMLEKALGSFAENLTSKSYLSGLSDAANAISNPTQFMGQYASNLAGSLVPNIVGRAAQAIDPTLRDVRPESTGLTGIPERMAKTIQSRIPGASSYLPAKKSFAGETVERGGDPLSRFVMPATYSVSKDDRALEEFVAEAGITPTKASRDVTIRVKGRSQKVRLSDDEYALISAADQRAAESARRLMRNPSFKRLPDTIEEGGSKSKEAEIKRVFDKLRSEARARAGRKAMQRLARSV
jgi:hypothetical protein